MGKNHGEVKELDFDAVKNSNRFYGMIETDHFVMLNDGTIAVESGRHWQYFTPEGKRIDLGKVSHDNIHETEEKLNQYFSE